MLREFKSDHPDAFYGYLNIVMANLVHDHFKAAHCSKRGSGAVEIAANEKIPLGCDTLGGASGVKSSERGILLREIDAALSMLAAGPHLERDRKLFWMYYLGLTADAIAGLPSIGLSTKGVESSLLRLTRLLRDEIGRDRPKAGNNARVE